MIVVGLSIVNSTAIAVEVRKNIGKVAKLILTCRIIITFRSP